MKFGFEKKFSKIQTNMVSVCLEYLEDKADVIYLYASYEAKAMTCDFFYNMGGTIYKKNELPTGQMIDIEKQMACLGVLLNDLEEIISICTKYEADMPTEIKIIYDVKNNKLNANYQYEDIFSNTELTANDIVEKWYQEILKT